MTERLFIDACVVTLPLRLSPVDIASKLSPRSPQAQGRFLTTVNVRYQPNVSTATAGVVALGLTTDPSATLRTIAANEPHHIGPVWKPATLLLPKDRINLQDWSTQGAPALYLVGVNMRGSISITCTLQLTLVASWPPPLPPPPPPPDPIEQLVSIDTQAFVGPVLEGFSLVCCAPNVLQPQWKGVGQVINIDLTRANGSSSTSSYGLRTPETKPYVAVRYGFGANFKYNYNSNNTTYSWQSNSQVIYGYTDQNGQQSAVPVSYYASWRPIRGSTGWWCDVRPSLTQVVLGGQTFDWYYPMCQLILYYYFPSVNIFASDFTPGVYCLPNDTLPCPPGAAEANKPQLVPLNMGKMQQFWSRFWHPNFALANLGNELQYRFTQAKYAFTQWPVNCPGTRTTEHESSPT